MSVLRRNTPHSNAKFQLGNAAARLASIGAMPVCRQRQTCNVVCDLTSMKQCGSRNPCAILARLFLALALAVDSVVI